jgi:hypothetical protein
LYLCPGLHARIEQATQADGRRIHWNQTTALHRMQVVINSFLEYHGWQADGPLTAFSFTHDYDAHKPRHFQVCVEIKEPEMIQESETDFIPSRREIQLFEEALSWVLTNLFASTHYLGLKKPPFW